MPMTKPCEQCGATMTFKPCLIARKRFCSRACQGRSKIAHLLAHRPPAKANAGSFQKGDNVGPANAKWVPSVPLTCEQCGRTFELKPWYLRVREKFNGRVRFCARACQRAHRRIEIGPLSHNWRGGGDLIHGKFWRRRRLEVIRAQMGTCARCRCQVGQRLDVHHIAARQKGQNPDRVHRHDNLIGLCRSCHAKTTQHPTTPSQQRAWKAALMASLQDHH
jgi:5-methylcytosine-specific restriction endonuclease McrA